MKKVSHLSMQTDMNFVLWELSQKCTFEEFDNTMKKLTTRSYIYGTKTIKPEIKTEIKTISERQKLRNLGKEYIIKIMKQKLGWEADAIRKIKREKDIKIDSSVFNRYIKEIKLNIRKQKHCDDCGKIYNTESHTSRYCPKCK